MASPQELETLKHIKSVDRMMQVVRNELIKRSVTHDQSKLESPEVEVFDEFTPKLKESTYGSDEYNQFLKDMKPALDHHYANNAHHPEHFENGVDGMNIVDIIEMLCDWKSATLRHNDGNLYKSIKINKDRFHLSDQLESIFNNSVKLFDGVDAGGIKQ